MDRLLLAKFTHSTANELVVEKNTYKQWVFRYTFLELEKDLSELGDISTKLLFDDDTKVTASVFAKEDGVIAGLSEIKYFLLDADPKFRPNLADSFNLDFNFKDGDLIKAGDRILTISSGVQSALAVERVLLNLLMRMSGVASYARQLVDLVKEYNVLIAPTRKTLWGLLDKRAVVLGGGVTHRLNLSDSIIIKDTHLDLIGRNFTELFARIAISSPNCRFLELEVQDENEALTATKGFDELVRSKKINTIPVIMFDNMSADSVASVINSVKEQGFYDSILFEASGGIDSDNIVDYAKSGVDIISMGALTNGVRSLDMSLKIDG